MVAKIPEPINGIVFDAIPPQNWHFLISALWRSLIALHCGLPPALIRPSWENPVYQRMTPDEVKQLLEQHDED